jgi:hypothetical protein
MIDPSCQSSPLRSSLWSMRATGAGPTHRRELTTALHAAATGMPPLRLSDGPLTPVRLPLEAPRVPLGVWLAAQPPSCSTPARDIATELGCNERTVRRALAAAAIARRGPSRRRQRLGDRDWLRLRYLEQQVSVTDIAAELGCHQSAIYKSLSLMSCGSAEAAGHEGDHGDGGHGCVRVGAAFVVADQAAVAGQPGQGALDDPTAG